MWELKIEDNEPIVVTNKVLPFTGLSSMRISVSSLPPEKSLLELKWQVKDVTLPGGVRGFFPLDYSDLIVQFQDFPKIGRGTIDLFQSLVGDYDDGRKKTFFLSQKLSSLGLMINNNELSIKFVPEELHSVLYLLQRWNSLLKMIQ